MGPDTEDRIRKYRGTYSGRLTESERPAPELLENRLQPAGSDTNHIIQYDRKTGTDDFPDPNDRIRNERETVSKSTVKSDAFRIGLPDLVSRPYPDSLSFRVPLPGPPGGSLLSETFGAGIRFRSCLRILSVGLTIFSVQLSGVRIWSSRPDLCTDASEQNLGTFRSFSTSSKREEDQTRPHPGGRQIYDFIWSF